MKTVLRIGSVGLLTFAIAAMPLQLLAQTTAKPAGEKKAAATKTQPAAKKKSAHPFRGKLAEVDKKAMTIKIGKSIYYITSETKITKDGKPAILADGVIGEQATGYAKPAEDGKMFAASLKFGAKPEPKSTKKQPKAAKEAKD